MKTKRIFIIEIYCAKCAILLYRYRKEGPGSLVKCFVSGIIEDKTNGDRRCPKCGTEFCRLGEIHGRPIHKIVQGKIFTKGHCPK